jgi:hypothetical protein
MRLFGLFMAAVAQMMVLVDQYIVQIDTSDVSE